MRTNSEVFDLDIAKYVEARSADMEEYLNLGFKELYEYPLRSFLFNPRVGVRRYIHIFRDFLD